jgi:hypothetical protein
MDSPTLEPGHAQRKVCEFPLLALFGHGLMSDLSPLSRVKRRLVAIVPRSSYGTGVSCIPASPPESWGSHREELGD